MFQQLIASLLVLLLCFISPLFAQSKEYPFLTDDAKSDTLQEFNFNELNSMLEMRLHHVRRIIGSGKPSRKILESLPLWIRGEMDSDEVEVKGKPLDSPSLLPRKVRVLVLGLDRRKEWTKSHADAIHLFTVDTVLGNVLITTIPRGSRAPKIPGHPGKYVAQAYHVGGRKLMKDVLAKFLKVRIDYVVEFDFATAMRFLELIGYQGKTTLRFLRHRKSYGPGDYQRCHNQALFMKKQIPRLLPYFKKVGGEIFFRTAYNLVETDIPYGMARRLLIALLATDIENQPERITLEMRPKFHGKLADDIPAGTEMAGRVKEQYKGITGHGKDKSRNFSMFNHLSGIAQQLETKLGSNDHQITAELREVFQRKLWFQIDEPAVRKQVHKRLSELYANAWRNLGNETMATETMERYEEAYDLLTIWQLPDGAEIAVPQPEKN